MPEAPTRLLETAAAAMEAGDWSAARTAYEEVLSQGSDPDALDGLGTALWWLGETVEAVRSQERAYAEHVHRGEPARAVDVAVSLSMLYRASLGNAAASRGWMHRATRLVKQHALPEPVRGWAALCHAAVANDDGHPDEAEEAARQALAGAGAGRDRDLEMCARSELGTALVQSGRVEEGLALLDESMAGSLAGEAAHPETVVLVGCRTVTCCCLVADVRRAAEWVRAADAFTREHGGLHMYTVCRVHHGMVLTAQGAWDEAERELTEALRVGEAAEPAMRAEALIRLAELRVAQGRVDEAAQLLVGLEDHPVAVPALAGIYLARDRLDVARTLLARRSSELPPRGPEKARVAELLVDAEIRSGRAGRALEVAEAQWADELTGAVRYRAEATLGRALSATGRTKDAVTHLERAVAGYGPLDLPWDLGRAHLSLARALGRDDPGAGTLDAEAALRIFDRLGAARDADAAAEVLRDQGAVAPVRRGPRAEGRLTARESEVLALLGEGLTNREVAERLFLTRKTVEHHVHRVLTKLGLRNRAEAAAWVLRHEGRGR